MRKSEKIQVRLDPKLLERLRQEAETRGLGMSALVRWALLSFFDNGVDNSPHSMACTQADVPEGA